MTNQTSHKFTLKCLAEHKCKDCFHKGNNPEVCKTCGDGSDCYFTPNDTLELVMEED